MTGDQWLIIVCGGAFLAIPLGMLIVDRLAQRHRRRAADALTALWDDEHYLEGDR